MYLTIIDKLPYSQLAFICTKKNKVTQKLRNKSFNKNFVSAMSYNNIAFTKGAENPKLSLNTNHLATLSILGLFILCLPIHYLYTLKSTYSFPNY